MLIILSGRSGTGKTTIAREAARRLGAVHVRIDSIEQAMHSSALALPSIDDAGYRVGYAVAGDNLRLGRTVVADSVNPIAPTRDAWRDVARRCGVGAIEVEVVCSDPVEHRRRVETRPADIAGHRLPSWSEVTARHYEPWNRHRVVLDTAHASVGQSVDELSAALLGRGELTGKPSRLLVITGSMGSGKTTVMAEASDILNASGIGHAAIDLDALGIVHRAATAPRDVARTNLEAVWRNIAAAGVDALILSAAVERAVDLDGLRAAVGAGSAVVCRLRAPIAVMEDRIRVREPGMLQPQFVERVATLERILDSASLEDFALTNDGRPVTEVAREMLVRAGWLES
jgi:predicted kinase